MKKACFGFTIILILGLAACGLETDPMPPLPTLAVEENVPEFSEDNKDEEPATEQKATTTPEPTATLEATVTPEPTATPKATVTPEPTATPKATVTPEPTATPKATVTPEPTATPKATATPEPTVTPKVTVTPEPTATPRITQKPVSSEIEELLAQGKVYQNTVIRGEVCTGEAEANEFVRKKSLIYSSFAVIVEDVTDLHSAREYITLYPEIEHMVIEKIDRYDNGYCAVFQDVEAVDDANLCYAIRTGNYKVLSTTEREILTYLEAVLNQTGARKLATVEAVKALHDYLVLELKYDETFQDISHSPEGVIKNQTAVCDGYARTMQLLLLMSGIECRIVSGTADGLPHAWNLVKVEDDWYHVDVTWDDPVPDVEGKVGYLYFLKNDADMAKTHTWTSDIACTANKYQVYLYQEVVCESYSAMRDVYAKQIDEKEYLTFCYPKNGELTQDLILDFVMNELQRGLTYYPEKELTDYMVLEIVNPLWMH